MSDETEGRGDDDLNKHGVARELAEAALRARRAGDDDRADALLDQARRTDPLAVEDLLLEIGFGELSPERPESFDPATADAEVAAISRQVKPQADAPSRAGITDTGSGADDEGL